MNELKKIKITFTTSHPANYIDTWLVKISEVFTLDVIYYKNLSMQKPWKNKEFFKGYIYNDIGFWGFLKMLLRSDFALISGTNYPQNIFAVLLLSLLGKKVAMFSDYPNPETLNNKKQKIIKRIFLRLLSDLYVVTEECKQFYIKNYNINSNKIKIFPYAHMKKNRNFGKINNERNKKIIEEKKIKLFISNSFIDRKGYDTLFRAFQEINKTKKLDDFEISIAGLGANFEEYKTISLKNKFDIKFLGWIEKEEYYEQIKNCDVLIHASHFEPYGIPPMDAMNNGKLVIVSDGVKSINNFIDSGKNGFQFKIGDYKGLSKILLFILENPDTIYKLGREGQEALKDFNVEKIIINSLKESLSSK